MQNQSKNTLILKLSTLLMSKQVKSDVICEALSLLCSQCGFSSAFVYNINQYNEFHLAEHFGPCNCPTEHFTLDAIPTKTRAFLAGKILYQTGEKEGFMQLDNSLFSLFPAYALAVMPIVDNYMQIYGLIVFEIDSSITISDETTSDLLPAFVMLGRYVGMRMYQHKLSFAQASLESVLDNTGIDIYVNDFYTHDILYVNKSMAAPYGGQNEFLGEKCWKVLFPGQTGPCEFCPQKKLIDKDGNPTKVYTWDYQRPFDGSWFRVFSAAFRWADGRLAHVVSSADISDNKRNEALIEYMANYDDLTHLPNRRMLISSFTKKIKEIKKNELGYILFFDIDGFKAINDNFGHDSGDEFLIELGRFFSDIPMLKNYIYRNGGDEFVAMLFGNITETHIRNLAGFIFKRFAQAWHLKKGDIFCNVSIGVSCYPQDGTTAEELISKADQAMYKVKKAGGGNICFAETNLNFPNE